MRKLVLLTLLVILGCKSKEVVKVHVQIPTSCITKVSYQTGHCKPVGRDLYECDRMIVQASCIRYTDAKK